MNRSLRPWLVLLVVASCSGERAPANDTAVSEELPPDDAPPSARRSTWNASAGALFAVRSGNGNMAWLVDPNFGDNQGLDTMTAAAWNVEGRQLSLIDGAQVIGAGRISGVRYDSTCAGWPMGSITPDGAVSAAWRVAFPEGAVEGTAFDSLPFLAAADSAERARDGALAASRLPDDTASAFRGRPFSVRQAARFSVGTDTIGTLFEIVRLVPQEANPLQEQILILTEEGPGRPPEARFFEREIGAEESMGSIELLGILRVKASGRLALLVRREREAGFVLEWIERNRRGIWVVRWRSATDSC